MSGQSKLRCGTSFYRLTNHGDPSSCALYICIYFWDWKYTTSANSTQLSRRLIPLLFRIHDDMTPWEPMIFMSNLTLNSLVSLQKKRTIRTFLKICPFVFLRRIGCVTTRVLMRDRSIFILGWTILLKHCSWSDRKITVRLLFLINVRVIKAHHAVYDWFIHQLRALWAHQFPCFMSRSHPKKAINRISLYSFPSF